MLLVQKRSFRFLANQMLSAGLFPSKSAHGGFAHGALVGGGIDCAAAAADPSPLDAEGIPMFAGVGSELDGVDTALVGVDAATVAAGCLPAHGAMVPDSETVGGVPLLETGADVLSSLPGSSIFPGPLAQGAAVPIKGLGLARPKPLYACRAVVLDSGTEGGVPLLVGGSALLSDGSMTAVGPVAQGADVPTKGLGLGGRLSGMVVVWLAHGAWVPD